MTVDRAVWTALPDGVGTMLAVGGAVTAAAQLGYCSVWSGQQLVSTIVAPQPMSARPTVVGQVVRWGRCRVDLSSGPAPEYGTVALPPEQVIAAYSACGTGAVAVTRTITPGSGAIQAGRVDDTGAFTPFWAAEGLAPDSVWCGHSAIVVGTPDLLVFASDGSPSGSLGSGTTPVRLEADADERLLLVVEPGLLSVWQLGTRQRIGRLAGQWSDADLSPDGTRLVTVDLSGRVELRQVTADLPLSVDLSAGLPDGARATGVAVSDSRVAASFGDLPAVRTRDLPS